VAGRVVSFQKSLAGNTANTTQVPTLNTKKKRPYTKRTETERSDTNAPRLKQLEELNRLTFLLTLDVDVCTLLVAQVFPEHVDQPEDAWLIQMATDRVRGNCRSWKSLTVQKMRESISYSLPLNVH
jgi:hypothetical protein